MDVPTIGQVIDAKQILAMLIWMNETIEEARYAIAAMFTLLLYEWVVGLEKEVRLVHKARWTSIKILYLLCRYYPILLWVPVTWAYVGDHTREECTNVARPLFGLLAPLQFFSQAVMVMRAFAFAGRDLRVLILLGLCYLVVVGLNIYIFCINAVFLPRELYYILPRTGCFPDFGDEGFAIRLGWSMLAAILMDLISLTVVCIYCIRSRSRDISLARYFVNQGLMAFIFISLVNIATAVAFFRPPLYHTGIGIPIIFVLSNIVACRVILELRARVSPTAQEIERQHESIIRNALMTREGDSWTMDEVDHHLP